MPMACPFWEVYQPCFVAPEGSSSRPIFEAPGLVRREAPCFGRPREVARRDESMGEVQKVRFHKLYTLTYDISHSISQGNLSTCLEISKGFVLVSDWKADESLG